MTTNQTIDGVPLMPCPFCGKEPRYVPADYVDSHGNPWPFAECSPCNVGAPVEFWNERAAKPKGEPVAWQFEHDGKWHNGDDRIKDHYKNTVNAGYKVRNLYAEQPAPVAVDALSTGFYVTESGGGKYAINIGFRSMADMQAADAQLRELLKSR